MNREERKNLKLNYISNQAHMLKVTAWYKVALKTLLKTGEMGATMPEARLTPRSGQGGRCLSQKGTRGCYVGAVL